MVRRPWLVLAASVVLLALVFLAAWPGNRAHAAAAGGAGLQPGNQCTLYFRGDAAGQVLQSYIPAITNNASITGTIVSVDDHWITLSKDKKQCWVPRSVVLMVVQ